MIVFLLASLADVMVSTLLLVLRDRATEGWRASGGDLLEIRLPGSGDSGQLVFVHPTFPKFVASRVDRPSLDSEDSIALQLSGYSAEQARSRRSTRARSEPTPRPSRPRSTSDYVVGAVAPPAPRAAA